MQLFREGDIIGFSGRFFNSDMINVLTYGIPRWSLSHVGIVARKNKRSKWLVFEANEGVPWPCAITHKKHDGVQAHSLDLLLERYHGRMWHYPCNKVWTRRSEQSIMFLYDALKLELGTPYDWAGAKKAGGLLYSTVKAMMHAQDASSLFCSELVAMMLNEFRIWETSNVSMWSPNSLMRRLVREGVYRNAVRLK